MMTELQNDIYKTLLKANPPMDKETAVKTTITFEPCFVVVTLNGRLIYQGMQNNDIVALSRYKEADGYNVQIFPATQDFKLSQEQRLEIKKISAV